MHRNLVPRITGWAAMNRESACPGDAPSAMDVPRGPAADAPGRAMSRLPQIDVLRGLAALGVFAFHVSGAVGFPKRTLPPFELFGQTWARIPSILSFGATGVSLFFVLSGFCLTLAPMRQSAARIQIGAYALDRIARIYPAYCVAVLFSAWITNIRGIPWSIPELLGHLFFLQGGVQQWALSLNGALWSMSTEAQFYLVFPLLFLAIVRFTWPITVVAVAALVLAFRLYVTNMPSAMNEVGGIGTSAFLMNNLPGRLLEFVLGMGLAGFWVAERGALSRWSTLLLAPATALGLWARGWGPAWLAEPMTGIMYAAITGFAVTHFAALRSESLWAAFGRSSYSFFLLHLPIVSLVADYLTWPADSRPYAHFLALFVISVALTLPLSLGLYRFVELPLWRRARSHRR
jgi:peptidoglycan/LPS O-acetylase OafA/YrhL